ncbi:MAG: hypothetical protein Q9167_004906 [Letrouitia subvulpina]
MPEFNRFHISEPQEQILRLQSLSHERPLLQLLKVEHPKPEHFCTKRLWLPIAATIFQDKLEALQRQLNMADAGRPESSRIKPEWEEVGLKTLLWIAQAVFMDRNTYPEKIYDHALNVTGKKLLRASARQDNANVRQLLGENLEIWQAYAELLSLALPVLESQSLAPEEPINSAADSSSALLISTHYATLMKDLERLDDLLLIGRNILASTSLAQGLAGDSGTGRLVLKLIDVCVRVTTRGYDGEAGARITEAQWTNISAAYKKLLVTCLQFLSNAVQANEKRKLLLWLDLFASSRTADQYFSGNLDPRKDEEATQMGGPEGVIYNHIPSDPIKDPDFNSDVLVSNAMRLVQGTVKVGKETGQIAPDEAARITSQVMDTVEGMVNMTLEQSRRNALECDKNKQNVLHLESSGSMTFCNPPSTDAIEADQSWSWSDLPNPAMQLITRGNGTIKPEDMKCMRTPESAAVTLQAAKDQLMARLQDPSSGLGEDNEQQVCPTSRNTEEAGSYTASGESAEEENNEDDEDYCGSSDQARGLLTDVPLVLSPQEILALPMIVSDGIVPSSGSSTANEKYNQEMQAVRCNILLAQEAGRNLLRELLIFIAAWDLQDDEAYFKQMMQIMEAILANGLMPFAYQAFGEVKDIVSPAQSMVIKILTQIFRSKQGLPPAAVSKNSTTASSNQPREPSNRVDLLIIRYIFTTFRQCIIPETCALIYLQGQIRAGAALPDDFPLNLWDMERVYEGVYQFLEFFAVLTESEDWKGLLVSWEIVSELVTLLRELDASIPKAPLGPKPSSLVEMAVQQDGPRTDDPPNPPPVAVERPYDELPSDSEFLPMTYASGGDSPSPSQGIDSQDPSDFEWRNLKKLVVLVLSSLVWKSRLVQDQIRQYGGIEMILQCCSFDSNNPFIREHAIMCLRFLLEGNKENQALVKALGPKKGVPDEVADKKGSDTFTDEGGKSGLRTKDG